MRFFFLIIIGFICCNGVTAQFIVSGSVVDISKQNFVEHVRVLSTGGNSTFTDSLGRYSIMVRDNDSLSFIYNNKPTRKFPVKTILNIEQFDISLRIPVQSKYSILKEVIVYSKTYQQDSLENRQAYADVFEYQKPGLSTSVGPGGTVGADVNELINIFRFRRNRGLRSFQARLEQQEQEKYVDYRFNKLSVKRITRLESPALDSFIRWYRPSYEFASTSNELVFNQYILDASYQFRKLWIAPPPKKEERP